jgi:hypothetical protein
MQPLNISNRSRAFNAPPAGHPARPLSSRARRQRIAPIPPAALPVFSRRYTALLTPFTFAVHLRMPHRLPTCGRAENGLPFYIIYYMVEGRVANDTCRVRFLPGARKALGKVERSDPGRLPLILDAVANVIENGWILSVHSTLIKVLDQKRQIGEIRDMGSGGYRLFFCWRDGRSARTLFITNLEKKAKLKGKARVQAFIDSADRLCRRYFDEMKEEEL